MLPLAGTPAGGAFSGTGVAGAFFVPGVAGVGSFDVAYTIQDTNGCFNTDSLEVSVLDAPTGDISGLSSSYCLGNGDVTLTVNPAGGQLTGAGISGNTFSPDAAGAGEHIISYVLTNADNCTTIVNDTVNVFDCTSVEDQDIALQLEVYPNPFDNHIVVQLNTTHAVAVQVAITDVLGKEIQTRQVYLTNGSNQVTLNGLSTLPSGAYVLSIRSDNYLHSRVMIKSRY